MDSDGSTLGWLDALMPIRDERECEARLKQLLL